VTARCASSPWPLVNPRATKATPVVVSALEGLGYRIMRVQPSGVREPFVPNQTSRAGGASRMMLKAARRRRALRNREAFRAPHTPRKDTPVSSSLKKAAPPNAADRPPSPLTPPPPYIETTRSNEAASVSQRERSSGRETHRRVKTCGSCAWWPPTASSARRVRFKVMRRFANRQRVGKWQRRHSASGCY
jgi:hypothetical protein